jgi:FAD/FMN-containing dehydrogenase
VVPGKVSTLSNSNIKSTQNPSLIVHPTSTSEVSDVLRTLHSHLQGNHISITVFNPGQLQPTSHVNGAHSLTLDLHNFKGIFLNGDKSIVTIGAAETWSSVQEELRKYDLEVGGGNTDRSSGCKILTIC